MDPGDRSAAGEALAGPTMLLPTAGPLLTPAQRPVEHLADLDVVVSRLATGLVCVELVDRRSYVELVSLGPREATSLAGLLVAKSARARETSAAGGHDPGSDPKEGSWILRRGD